MAGILVAVLGPGLIRPAASEEGAAAGPEVSRAAEAGTPRPGLLLDLGDGLCYGLSTAHGFLISEDGGLTWEARNDGLPHKAIHPGRTVVRRLTSPGADPLRPGRVAVTTGGAVLLSEDRGRRWTRLAGADRLGPNAFLTAVALSPWDGRTLLVGTSFDGIFETRDLGKTWTNVTRDLKGLYRGAGFWEEIAALSYHPGERGAILLACGFGRGLYI